jgi:hypothetical protein
VKTPEDQLVHWTVGAITFDFDDGPGIVRTYTQEGWTNYCTHLLVVSGSYDAKPNEVSPVPDKSDDLERCLDSIRALVHAIDVLGAETVTGQAFITPTTVYEKWKSFAQRAFDPKTMLRYSSKKEVVAMLHARLSDAFVKALS